jgi:hypothetical protein
MAIELFMYAMNDGYIEKRAGVSRQTINTWRNHSSCFTLIAQE